MVKVYDPAGTPVMFGVVAPFDHKYVYGATPPEVLVEMAPAPSPKQRMSVMVGVTRIGFG